MTTRSLDKFKFVIFQAVFCLVFLYVVFSLPKTAHAAVVTISGSHYQTNETSLRTTGLSMKLSVNGSSLYATTSASGNFTFNNVTVNPGDLVTIWTDAGSYRESLVFKYGAVCEGGGSDCTGLKLFENRVIVGPDYNNTENSITNADLAACDNDTGSSCTDTDIGFTSNSGALNLTYSGNILRLKDAFARFAPGGNVTATNFSQSNGFFNGGSGTIDINGTLTLSGGEFTSTSGTMYISGDFNKSAGTFTQSTGTVNFDGSTAAVTCTGGATFGSVTISKSYWVDFTINSGCDVTLAGTNPSSSGNIINKGQTTVTGNWTLSGGYTSNAATSNLIMNGNLDINNYGLTLTAGTFPATVKNIYIEGNLNNSGNLLSADINLSVDGGSNSTLTCGNADFNTVSFSKSGAHLDIIVYAGCILPISGTNPTSVGNVNNQGRITIDGNWTINGGYNSSASTSELIMSGNRLELNTYYGSLNLISGTFPANVKNLIIESSFNNTGNLLSSDIVLSLDGGSHSTLTCGNADFDSVSISKSGGHIEVTINAGCIVPIAGTNPSFTASIINRGRVIINGNWALTGGYNSNAATAELVMSGNVLDLNSYYGTLTLTAGIFPENVKTIYVENSLINSGNLLSNDIDLYLDSGSSASLNCGNASFNSITYSKPGDYYELTLSGGSCTTKHFTRVSLGVVNNPASPYTFNVSGNLTVNGNGNFGGANLTLNFVGSSVQTIFSNIALPAHITVNKTGEKAMLNSSINAPSITVGQGTFDLNGKKAEAPTFTVQASGTLMLIGSETASPTLNSGSTVQYRGDGDGLPDTYYVNNWSYSNLLINAEATDEFIQDSTLGGMKLRWKMDEASGTAVADTSGLNQTGTAASGATVETGQYGNARIFNGTSNGYVSYAGNGTGIFGNASLTLAAWIKPTNVASGTQMPLGLLVSGSPTTGSQATLMTEADGRVAFHTGNCGQKTTESILTNGNWYHVAITKTPGAVGSTTKIYVNGVERTSSVINAGGFSNCTPNFNIAKINAGGGWYSFGYYFYGSVDDLRVYDKALTPTEITAISNNASINNAALSIGQGFTLTGGKFMAPATMTIGGNLIIAGGSEFTAPATTLSVGGSWTNNGTFYPGTGKVVLNGTNQEVAGTTTFYDFEKIVTTAATLTFPGDVTKLQTFMNSMTLKGASTALLTLASSNPGVHFRIDAQGITRSIEYLSVSWSNNINATAIVTSGRSITDGFNNIGWDFSVISTPEASSLTILPTTDGSGYLRFNVSLSDGGGDDTRLKVEYSDDNGSNWYDPIIAEAIASIGTADIENSAEYQIGSANPVDTSSGLVTLTVAWDTRSSGNGHGSLDNMDQGGYLVRVTPNDIQEDGAALPSAVFALDNLRPTVPGGFAASEVGGAYISFSWITSSENHFDHYEIWYGANQAEVESRSGSAAEWDDSDDPSLADRTATTTTITGLTIDTPYYFRLYPVDDSGNVGATASYPVQTIRQFIWDGGGDGTSWNSANNWDVNQVPGAEDEAVINTSVTVNLPSATAIKSLTLGNSLGTRSPVLNFAYNAQADGALAITAGNLIVHPGASITHAAGTANVVGAVFIDIQSGNADIVGSINADFKGYATANGPGRGSMSNSGSGHGGTGGIGNGAYGTAGGAYDSITDPSQLGSGSNLSVVTVSGGGLVKLNVAGTLNLTGSISANGSDGQQYGAFNAGGGGSGGTVKIVAGLLMGNGVVSANGGNTIVGGAGYWGGGGGGGRIAVYFGTDSSTISFRAYGGNAGQFGSFIGDAGIGGAGTVYKKAAAQTYGDLIIDNNDKSPLDRSREILSGRTPLSDTQTFDFITVSNYGYLDVRPGASISYTFFDWSNQGAIVDSGGSFPLLAASDLTVPVGSILVANTQRTFDNLTVHGILTHSSNHDTKTYSLDLTVNNDFTLSNTGSVNSDHSGYWVGFGAGKGANDSNGSGGGGYGNSGGMGTAGAGGSAYGSETQPADLGSPGGVYNGGCFNWGGRGAGAIKLRVNGHSTIDGVISANGQPGCDWSSRDGGGAGGSINLILKVLKGGGSISARGGNSSGVDGGGGSGGRVAVYYLSDFSTVLGNISVQGGSGSTQGGTGTAYILSIASYSQQDYRWYLNENSTAPGAALAGENGVVTTNAGKPVRLRLSLSSAVDLPAEATKFTLQYATSQEGPWKDVGKGDGWWDASFHNRRKIVFDNSASAENLQNFPVLVSFSDINFNYSKTHNNGSDLRFVDPDGTELYYEIQKWNPLGTSLVWVKVPQLDNTNTDYVWVYYNNPSAAPAQSPANVWESGFKGVWHMDETSGTSLTDSTANAKHAVKVSETDPTAVTGIISGAQDFDGSNDYAQVAPYNITSSTATFSGWIKGLKTGDYSGIIYSRDASQPIGITYDYNSNRLTYSWNSGSSSTWGWSGPTIPANQWAYVSVSIGTNQATGYVCYSGTCYSATNTLAHSAQTWSTNFKFGYDSSASNRKFDGSMDELRISSVARSSSWINAEYRNMTGQTNGVGNEESRTLEGIAWRYQDNSFVNDGAILASTPILSTSATTQIYAESSPSILNSRASLADEFTEYDFSLVSTPAAAGSTYYFRLLDLERDPLNGYSHYPAIELTAEVPETLSQSDFQFFANTDDVTPGAALADLNSQAAVNPNTDFRLRMNLASSAEAIEGSLRFNLQYATAETGPWYDIAASGQPWWNQSFLSRRKIIFDNSAASEHLPNFPALITLSNSNFNYSKTHNNGADIRFVDGDGTELSYEIEKWNSSGTSSVWVRVPQIDNTNSDYIWMYYNNAEATDAQAPDQVWETSYKAVWHMAQNPESSLVFDSTANDNDGTPQGTMTSGDQVQGVVGNAINFDGTNDYLDVGNKANLDITGVGLTVSAWVYADTASVYDTFMMKTLNTGWNNGYGFYFNPPNVYFYVSGYLNTGYGGLSTAGWHYVVGRYTGSAVQVFVDNVKGNDFAYSNNITSSTGTGEIGRGKDNAYNFDGRIDEMRISAVARSTSWLNAEYQNMTGEFVSFGGEEEDRDWEFRDNTLVSTGNLTSTLLATSDVYQTYQESNPTPYNPNRILAGQKSEYDFSLSSGKARQGTTYYFRLVKSDGEELSSYTRYPSVIVAAPPPYITQANYRWFANADSVVPDPALASENSSAVISNPQSGARLRMNLGISVNTLPSNYMSFKLQWAHSPNGQWSDVSASGSSGLKFKTNPSVLGGSQLDTLMISSSNVAGRYGDGSATGNNPLAVSSGQYVEYDFALDFSALTWGENYFLRMVKANGSLLDSYFQYPMLTVGAIVSRGSQAPVDNGEAGEGTPTTGGTGQGQAGEPSP